MYVQDEGRQLALLTDRAQGEPAAAVGRPAKHLAALLQAPAPRLPCLPAGGASLRSGQMEVMVHRRTLEGGWVWSQGMRLLTCWHIKSCINGIKARLTALQTTSAAWRSR